MSDSATPPKSTDSALESVERGSTEVALLQQRVWELEAEVARHKSAEEAVQQTVRSLQQHHEDLNEFLENAVEGVHWVGPDGTILRTNKAELNLLGYTKEEYIGRHISEFHADSDVINSILTRLTCDEVLHNQEARLRCKDGSIKHVLINSNVYWRDGKFIHTRCFTRDITARREAQEQLFRAEERFRMMNEATPDGVGIFQPLRNEAGAIQDFRYVYVNPVTAKSMRRSPSEMVGRTLLELIPGLDKTPFWTAFCRVADTRIPESYEQPYTEHGWQGWFRNTVVSLGDEIAVTYSDISDRRRAEESARLGADVGKALTGTESLSEQLRSCAEATIRHLDGALAGVWTVNAGSDVLERQAVSGDAYKSELDGPPVRIPIGSFKIGVVAQERKPHLTNDLLNDPLLTVPQWATREGLVAFAGYPLLVQARLVGVLAMFSRSALASSTLDALASVADVIALGIERRRTDALRTETEGRRAATLEAAMDCIIVIDQKGTITDFNPAAEKTFQYPREAALGKEMADLIIPPRYRDRHRQGLKRYVETGKGSVIGTRIEISALRADGSEFPVELSITPIAVGGAISFTGYLRDITERRNAEEERAALLASEQGARAALATTLNSIGDAVIATDVNAFITFMNPVAEALTGWSLKEATGEPLRNVFRIVNERTRQEIESPAERVIRDGRVVGLANHTVLIARSGVQFAIDDSGAPINDAEGKLIGVVIVFRDVTSKRKLDDRKEFLAEATSALALALDVRQTLTNLAQLAVPKLADWCAVDVILEGESRPQQIVVAHVDPAKVQLAADLGKRYPPDPNATTGAPNVLRTGKSELYPEIPAEMLAAATVDAEHLRLARELRLESAMVVPLKARGHVLGVITFIYAESGRRYTTDDLEFAEDLCRRASIALDNARLYESEQNARRSADLANRSKDDFLATVSHELRTPLNAMLGWTRLLRAGDLPKEKHDRALETIERNAVTQTQLIEDLLDVSRIISGKLRLDVQSMEMSDLIELAVDSLKLASEVKGIRIVSSVDSNAGQIMGDPQRLQQVIWNLVSNAIKFTPKGGRIRVTVERVDSNLRIAVADTGQGIKAEFLPQVFERFRQADGATTRTHGGLGLGLAISRHIVELHGGSIQVQSKGVGEGATFIVLLPMSPVRQKMAGTSALGTVVSGMTFESRPELKDLKVLIVDDEADARALLVAVLERCGALVVAADSAADALAKLRTDKPDVLVSDIGMPGEDGYDLIRQVRALSHDDGGNTPAAALTAYARATDRRKALDAGFMMHIPKPVEPAELVAVIANLTRFAVRR